MRMTLITTPALAATQISEYTSLYYALAKMDERTAKANGQPNATYSSQSVRNSVIERLCDEYISVRGKRPEPAQLDRMATLLLRDDMVAFDASKRYDEYPVLSERKLSDKSAKNAPINATDIEQERKSVGSRRKRAAHENNFVDAVARIRNKERRKRYKAFINGEIPGILCVKVR